MDRTCGTIAPLMNDRRGGGRESGGAASGRFTVIIVTWDGDRLLDDCLASISGVFDAPPRCVVVDNASLGSTRETCARHPFVTYVPAPRNLGFAGGNNLGLPRCGTEYVCLLNNDTVVRRDSFTPLVRFLDDHPRADVAQGTLTLPREGGVLDDCGTLLRRCGTQKHLNLRRPDPGNLAPSEVFSAKGAFMMVRRSAVERLGGRLFYDHFGSYYEETDFCHRVWLSGGEVWFVPTPPVEHLMGATSSRFDNAAIWRRYVGNTAFSYLVNFSAAGLLKVALPFAATASAYALLCLLKGRFSLAKAILSAPLDTFRLRAEIRESRKAVQSARRITDGELLSRVGTWRKGGCQ